MPQTRTRTLLIMSLTTLVACGGGDKKATPDAKTVDAAPDARVCATLTAPTGTAVDAKGFDATNKVMVVGGAGGDAGDGNQLTFQVEVYGGIESSLAGTFDLTMGNQNNYKTCAICVRAYSLDASGNPIKEFFQSSGSVTLTADPFTNGHLVASFSNVTLQEVMIASDFTSTPVAGGLCATYGTFSVDHTKAPNAYTCQYQTYSDGTTCDCQCGGTGSASIIDTDCAAQNAPVNGCTTGQICNLVDDTCHAPVTNDKCATATPITVGTPVTGTTVNASNNYDAGLEGTTCTGFPQGGADVAYSVVLTANQAITVTLSGLDATYDGSIALLGPGAATICDANPIATCVKGADAANAGANETFTYTATTAGTYYIIVDSFATRGAGAFTLTVN